MAVCMRRANAAGFRCPGLCRQRSRGMSAWHAVVLSIGSRCVRRDQPRANAEVSDARVGLRIIRAGRLMTPFGADDENGRQPAQRTRELLDRRALEAVRVHPIHGELEVRRSEAERYVPARCEQAREGPVRQTRDVEVAREYRTPPSPPLRPAHRD